jgi:hypothetical protein
MQVPKLKVQRITVTKRPNDTASSGNNSIRAENKQSRKVIRLTKNLERP